LLERPELRLSLGRAGRQHVQERFDWSAISSRYALLMDGLIRGRS
jgi:glycosyltransferase involved in cell wall biosynthesis